MTLKSIAIAAALTFSSSALAAPNAVTYGTISGKLTAGELVMLQADKAALSRAKTAAMRDGRITPRERAKIDALERKLRRDTRVLMTNRIRR